jgi:hypothetical protein
MVYFQTKNPNFGCLGMEKFGIFLGHLENFTTICCIFGNLVAFWYILTRFGTLSQEKSGNPALNADLENNP